MQLNGRQNKMMKTNASIRRFVMLQKTIHPNVSENLIDRYETYVWCVARYEYPKTLTQWLED